MAKIQSLSQHFHCLKEPLPVKELNLSQDNQQKGINLGLENITTTIGYGQQGLENIYVRV